MQGTIDSPIHYENEFMKVEYLSDKNVVITSYKGFAEDEIIKTGLLKAIDIVKNSNTTNMVFDNTRFEGSTPELSDWVKNKYFNLAYDTGVKNFAIVVPDHVYAAFSIEVATNNDMREVMNIEKFANPQEAIKWTALKK